MAGRPTKRASKRVLITGATGFLGGHLLASAPEHWELVAGVRDWQIAEEWGGMEMDLADPLSWRKRLHDLAPDAILHAAAMADTGACEKDPEQSFQINVKATTDLARYAGAQNIPFVFCSTDLVFDGTAAPYKPDAPVSPVMTYGRHKAEAEEAVREAHPQAIIARLPLMYGASTNPKRGLISGLRNALVSGRPVKLFHDEYRTAGHARRVAQGLWAWLLAQSAGEQRGGTWHFGGPQRLSRYAMALEVAQTWDLDPSAVQAVAQADVQTGSPRPADVSLDSGATFEKGWQHGSLAEELALMKGED